MVSDADSPILTEDSRLLIRRKHLMESLIELPEWKELESIGKAQADNHLQMLLASGSAGDERSDVYKKGVVYGIRLLLGTPSKIIEDANEIVQRMENVRDYRNTNDSNNFRSGRPDSGRVTIDDNRE